MKKKKSGFTLLEMIIVLALTVLIIGIAGSIFITGNKIFSDSDVKTTLQMEAKDIQEKLSDICMEASDIQIYDDGTNATIIFYDNDGEKQNNIEIKKDGANLLWTPISKDGALLIYNQHILTRGCFKTPYIHIILHQNIPDKIWRKMTLNFLSRFITKNAILITD